MAKNNLINKVAIITGSSNGIGKATAKLLIKEGVAVVINGRDESRLNSAKEELKALGGKVLVVCGDISDIAFAKEMVQRTMNAFGRIDILINNAGISMRGDLGELNPKVYKMVFDTNVQGAINVTIPTLPYIRERNGSIVFISSLAGIHGLPSLSAYSASKMALRAIAESLRIEEAKSHIHIGLIQAGFTQIEGNKHAISSNGDPVHIRKRPGAASIESVSKAIVQNIKRRKYVSTLTLVGRLHELSNKLSPRLTEMFIRLNEEKIRNG